MAEDCRELAANLASVAKSLHVRGWLPGTSGNLSAVAQRQPLRLAMSPSGIDKGELTADQVLLIDENGRVVSEHNAKPSDETLLHISIAKQRKAGAILHTHTVWNTIMSDLYAAAGGINIKGFEMLKGLEGVRTHEHSEWLPIIDNSQDMPALAETIVQTLTEFPDAHGILLLRHGLYTWGENLAQAKRHLEILEFLLETLARRSQL